MNNIKVSIIIPIYNVEPYIERCIISVLNQSYKNIEIIIINDCTPDKSIELINKLLNNKYSSTENIHILNHEKNKGLSAARNTGIMNATGDYLYFLDSDDSITHDCIEVLVNALSLNIDFVIGD